MYINISILNISKGNIATDILAHCFGLHICSLSQEYAEVSTGAISLVMSR